MTIAQALKEKNKKTATIKKLWSKISNYNSITGGNARPYDLDQVWAEFNKEITQLVELKAAIHAASAQVRPDIFMLSELKSKAQFLTHLNVSEGTVNERFSGTSIVTEAHFNIKWKDSQIEEIEKAIDLIQERLDKYNHTTHI